MSVDNVVAPDFGGIMTPEQTLLSLLEHTDNMELFVACFLGKDDRVYVAHSEGSTLKKLGLTNCLVDDLLTDTKG